MRIVYLIFIVYIWMKIKIRQNEKLIYRNDLLRAVFLLFVLSKQNFLAKIVSAQL